MVIIFAERRSTKFIAVLIDIVAFQVFIAVGLVLIHRMLSNRTKAVTLSRWAHLEGCYSWLYLYVLNLVSISIVPDFGETSVC